MSIFFYCSLNVIFAENSVELCRKYCRKVNINVVVNYIREHVDNTAFNWMLDDKVYQSIKYCSDAIEELDVIKSFYVYRLASDKVIDYSSKMYQEYNKLIEE